MRVQVRNPWSQMAENCDGSMDTLSVPAAAEAARRVVRMIQRVAIARRAVGGRRG